MAISMQRVTQGVTFEHGIRDTQYSEKPVGLTLGGTQSPIMPGSTTVSEALADVFPKDPTVSGLIAEALAAAGDSPELRTAKGFAQAARKALRSLRGGGEKAAKAAAEIENLMNDTELLDAYRASLLES